MSISIRFIPLQEISAALATFWQAAQPDFFSALPWLQLLSKEVLQPSHTQGGFILAEEQGQVMGLCPVYRTHSAWGINAWHSLSNYYSPFIKPLVCSPNHSSTVVFLQALKLTRWRWDVLTLTPTSAAEASSLLADFKQVGIPAIPYYCFTNWYLEVNGRTFAHYFAGLSSRVRNTVQRKTKQFEYLSAARTIIITQHDHLERYIADYAAVYRESWKQAETFPDFMAELIRLAADQGALRLGIAYLAEEPIAVQFWIVADGCAYIYKLAYKEQYKQHGAGTILSAKLMQYVMDIDKVHTVDYLTGDDAYKQDWMSSQRQRWGVVAFNKRSAWGMLALLQEMPKVCLRWLRGYLRNESIRVVH